MKHPARAILLALSIVGTTAASLSAQFVYMANFGSSNISGYHENPATGVLTQAPGSPFSVIRSPWSIAVHPSGRFAYATGYYDDAGINGYSINSRTGALIPIP